MLLLSAYNVSIQWLAVSNENTRRRLSDTNQGSKLGQVGAFVRLQHLNTLINNMFSEQW